ncbi:MAG: response regulator [Candidatus Marinimicrobia bacterium]|jgi:two-component system, cell cycle response regulator DivK|nr:response regulator [Candidatus Neomarinimicrobiota bacterium]MBT3824824.1 response regulator [Candidatus Neomarinimicrobiota bacterium]MBT4035127.1 response regulator [Candidatus Neomarinimicrobiota bacterium]MBT4296330.1 response regulator [Candidatus Neomarinimicrobiota bacterium]MBT4714706.1 response regulator [Candidatus Neomarinimicrobiota bacterium]
MNKTILVIEDNDDNMSLITQLLESAGKTVVKATTGMEGYEKTLELRPDIVLLDIQLPDIEGTEVLQMIRSNKEVEDIAVVAVTSYAMAGDREKLMAAGCNGYIEKPIDPFRILEELEIILKEQQ